MLYERMLARGRAAPNTKIIFVDPRKTPTNAIVDLHLQIKPGYDLAIMNAIAHVLVKEDMIDEQFIKGSRSTSATAPNPITLEEYRKFLEKYTPEYAAAQAGVPARDIVRAARMFGESPTAMSLWCMGLNQRVGGRVPEQPHPQPPPAHGQARQAGLRLVLPDGPAERVRRHPRGRRAVAPAAGHRMVANDAHRAEMEKLWKVPAGTIQPKPGLATIDLFRALETGQLKVLYVMCTNPGQSLPNVDRYRKAMQTKGAFLVVADAYHPTRTTELADVVLPAALWAEKEGVYACSERRYQLLSQAVKPLGEARPDFEILCDLGRRLGHGSLVSFKSPDDIWEEILTLCKGTVYDFSGMTRQRLRDAHGLFWPMPTEGHPGTKLRYVKGEDPLVPADHPTRMKFYGRPDGKAVVWLRPQKPPEEVIDAQYPFYYTTGRVIEHWHTATMTKNCKELQQANYESVAEIHPDDAKKLAVKAGDWVKLESRRGSDRFRVKVTDQSPVGLVYVHMHDQERMCNRMTNDAVDPVSRQPEFKVAAIRVVKV
jgi:nitrate reductase (cytochrome)